jgi:hypothetical protein
MTQEHASGVGWLRVSRVSRVSRDSCARRGSILWGHMSTKRPHASAFALGVSRSLLYSLIMSQQLFSVKVGKARRIPVQSLQENVGSLIDMQKAG